MNNKPFKTYNGGKNGSGVYQAIINQIPPHDTFISGFAGNCGVLANKKAATNNIAIDLDLEVVKAWCKLGIDARGYDVIEFIMIVHPSKDTFLFLDPPYLDEVRTSKQRYYKHDMRTEAEHSRFLRIASTVSNPTMIVHYPCELYDTMLKDWRKLDIQGRTRKGMRTERLYMNYPEPTELHDYQYFGKNYRQRERYKRIQTNFMQKISRLSVLERNYILQQLIAEASQKT